MTTNPIPGPIEQAIDIVSAENEILKLKRHLRRGLKALSRLGIQPAGDGPLVEITPDGTSLQFAAIPRERLLSFVWALEYLADTTRTTAPASPSWNQAELDLSPLLAQGKLDPHGSSS